VVRWGVTRGLLLDSSLSSNQLRAVNDVIVSAARIAPRKFKALERKDFRAIPQLSRLGEDHIRAMEIVARVLPFRVNSYVVDELIDWERSPDDPIFQLTFPQRGMLAESDFERMKSLLDANASPEAVRHAA